MRVNEILRHKGTEVATITPGATLADAAEVLVIRRIGALVVSTDGTSIEGIISERDIVRHVAEHGAAGLRSPVSVAMTAEVTTCCPSDSLEDLMRQMTDRRIRHLPVTDEGGRLGGIISIGDVVKHRVGELELEREKLTEYIQTGR